MEIVKNITMESEKEFYNSLDQYLKGTLSAEEALHFEDKMKHNPAFRKKVQEYQALLQNLKLYSSRNKLKEVLETAHGEMALESHTAVEAKVVPIKGWKKYAAMTAAAATVALVSIVGTLLIIRSLETEQTAIYKELRRNVEQIRKSQRTILEDIALTKEKEKSYPGTYAGSGFLVSANGYVVTSYHVVKESDSIYLENTKAGRVKATIVHSDHENDISILKIQLNEPLFKQPLPYSLSKTEANLAEEVYTLGFPREEVVFGDGSISALTGYKQNPNAYQVSIPVNPGNSGGPLLNNKGDLIGIISGIQTETSGAAFATKSTVLLNVFEDMTIDSLRAPLVLPKQNMLKNKNRVQQVSQWRDFVFMVRVYKN